MLKLLEAGAYAAEGLCRTSLTYTVSSQIRSQDLSADCLQDRVRRVSGTNDITSNIAENARDLAG